MKIVRVAAVASSVLLASVYIWYRGCGVRAAASPVSASQVTATKVSNDRLPLPTESSSAEHPALTSKPATSASSPIDASDIVVPPDILSKAELGDHFEGSKSAIMIPSKWVEPQQNSAKVDRQILLPGSKCDAHMFHSLSATGDKEPTAPIVPSIDEARSMDLRDSGAFQRKYEPKTKIVASRQPAKQAP